MEDMIALSFESGIKESEFSLEKSLMSEHILHLKGISVSAYQNFLIIDDDESIIFLIKKYLQGLGFLGDVHYVQSVNEAKEIFKTVKIDFILCDHELPTHTGISLLKALKSKPMFKDIPFLLVTKHSEIDLILLSKELGVSDVLVKPFQIEEFENKITSAWKHHSMDTHGDVRELQKKVTKLEEENHKLKVEIAKLSKKSV